MLETSIECRRGPYLGFGAWGSSKAAWEHAQSDLASPPSDHSLPSPLRQNRGGAFRQVSAIGVSAGIVISLGKEKKAPYIGLPTFCLGAQAGFPWGPAHESGSA